MDIHVHGEAVHVGVADGAMLLSEMERKLTWGEGFAAATLNLDHLVKLHADPAFLRAYATHDFVTADGNPVVWLSRLAGRPVDLLTGADLIEPVAALAAARGLPVGFLGSTQEALDAAARHLGSEVPGLDVRERIAPPMGLDPEGEAAMSAVDRMVAAGVRVVFVALGAPRQERLAARARERHPGLGFLGIGAGLDFWAGTQRRAPPWMRRLALEWLWRIASEPRRLARRYALCLMVLPVLAGRAARDRLVRAAGRGGRDPRLGA